MISICLKVITKPHKRYFSMATDTSIFKKKFDNEAIHDEKYEKFIISMCHLEFFISNAEELRETHFRTLRIANQTFQVFERYEVD